MNKKFNAICLDDEKIILDGLVKIIGNNSDIASIHGFSRDDQLFEWLKSNKADIAFLDVNMYGKTGMEIAEHLKQLNPRIYIVFISGHAEYAVDAFKLKANGYILKPADDEDIKREIDYIKEIEKRRKPKKRVYAHTFGNFDVFIDDEPIKFSYHLTKEVFAYLIDRRGCDVSMAELENAISLEYAKTENSAKSMIRTAIAELRKITEKYSLDDLFHKKRNYISVNVNMINCDFYGFIEGNPEVKALYSGEYMSNYSWAEYTNAWLDNNA